MFPHLASVTDFKHDKKLQEFVCEVAGNGGVEAERKDASAPHVVWFWTSDQSVAGSRPGPVKLLFSTPQCCPGTNILLCAWFLHFFTPNNWHILIFRYAHIMNLRGFQICCV